MKVIILIQGRGEGKTHDIIENHLSHTPLTDTMLFLTINKDEAKRVTKKYPHMVHGRIRVCSFHASAIRHQIKGTNPEHIFIDNANFLSSDAIKEIRMMLPKAKTLTVAANADDSGFIRYKLPELLLGVISDGDD